MCHGRQNGEPGIGHSGPIPTGIDLASAKQFEERHGMRGADAVGISHHNQVGALAPDEASGLPFAPSRAAKRYDYNLLPSYSQPTPGAGASTVST